MLRFAGLFVGSLFLLFLVFLSFRKSADDRIGTKPSDETIDFSLPGDINLQARAGELEELDARFAGMISLAAKPQQLAEVDSLIDLSETKLRFTLDSISKKINDLEPAQNAAFRRVISSFGSILNARKSISNIRESMLVNPVSLTAVQQKELAEKTELLFKDKRISELERLVANMDSKPLATTESPMPAGEEAQIIKQMESNAMLLKQQIDAQKTTIERLRTANEGLKTAQANFTSALVSEKNVESETKLEVLTADVSFAQVDCNLVRVDANQIISNAKQRRLLLMESLRILNSLIKSGNADIQQKARERLALLNKISSALRD